jgi:SPP1 gp7 family putative phage head morphogenesis protein
VSAALALWALWPRRLDRRVLERSIVLSRAEARAAGAAVAARQLRLERPAKDATVTKLDEARAAAATTAYTERIQVEAREAETVRAAGTAARPAINRVIVTETATAFNQGIVEEGKAIAAEFDIELRKMWSAEGDARTCEFCAAMNGLTVDLDEDFPDGNPGEIHPNCRCTVALIRKSKDEAA